MKTSVRFVLLLGLVFALSLTSKAVSIGQVLGQVIEKETHKPVAFAEIIFENKMDKVVVTANEYGFYYAHRLPTGKYQMRVTFNNRTFVMNNVRVYDSYSTEVNFFVSSNDGLPQLVEVENKEPLISAVTSTDVQLSNSNFNQPTQSLSSVLSMQPGVDVRNGKIYVKGSDQVRFFIDGTPVMGQPAVQRSW
jgi:hypothetical protein